MEVDHLQIGVSLDGTVTVHEYFSHPGLIGFYGRLNEFGQIDARSNDANNFVTAVYQTVDPDLCGLDLWIIVDVQLAFFSVLFVA